MREVMLGSKVFRVPVLYHLYQKVLIHWYVPSLKKLRRGRKIKKETELQTPYHLVQSGTGPIPCILHGTVHYRMLLALYQEERVIPHGKDLLSVYHLVYLGFVSVTYWTAKYRQY